jgi:hypothetical protein
MLSIVATVLAGLIGVAIIFIGVRAIVAPGAAVDFGIPGTPAGDRTFQAWLAVKGVRDMASGLFVFILIAAGTTQLLGWFMLAAACIPVGDALIVLRSGGPRTAAYGIHGATALVMLTISLLLLLA